MRQGFWIRRCCFLVSEGVNPYMRPSKSAFSNPSSSRKAAILGSVQYLQCRGHSTRTVAPTRLQCLAASSNPSQRRQ
eukprot:11872395-Alexandrium_andersonii.AAC.1